MKAESFNVSNMLALGIDIGGSGIKGSLVDISKGKLVSGKVRIPTPKPATDEAVVATVKQIIRELGYTKGPVGIGFPGVIRNNRIQSAVNLHDSMVGVNFAEALSDVVTGPVRVLNDADAAGFAEMEFGQGQKFRESGSVLMLTVGTGIGTVMFTNGHLMPNLELGHIEFKGKQAETIVSERARIKKKMSWKAWGKLFNEFLGYLEFLVQPDLIILGGGGVKKPDLFSKYIDIETPWELARSRNKAGMIGAAFAASKKDL